MKEIENECIEFKRQYTKETNKDIVAFANSYGGIVRIGVDDDGSIIGVQHPDDVMTQISGSLKDSISPDIIPFVDIVPQFIEGKFIINVTVQKGTKAPYYLREKGYKPSGVYVRKGSSSQPTTDDGIRRLIKESEKFVFEDEISLNQDLTFEFLKKSFTEQNLPFTRSQMLTLGIINSNGEFTNLAYIVSDQFQTSTKVATFEGIEKHKFFDKREFTGSVVKQALDLENYFNAINNNAADFENMTRVESRSYPTDALRETLYNCIIHRDYQVQDSNIINIYKDRIEFISVGGLVGEVNLETIKQNISILRNKKLAEIFRRLGKVEAFGYGIPTIESSYKNTSAKPLFDAAPGVFKVTLKNLNYLKDRNINADSGNRPSVNEAQSVMDDMQKVLGLFSDRNYIIRSDVEKALNISKDKSMRLLKKMIAIGFIEVTGKGQKTEYILK